MSKLLEAYDKLDNRKKLDYFRNLYYTDGNSTEQGIIANAINDIFCSHEFPELNVYEDNQYDMMRPLDDTPIECLNRYEIVFEVCGCRYYCFADAITVDEALGQFFRNHPNISYNMIIEHMEV